MAAISVKWDGNLTRQEKSALAPLPHNRRFSLSISRAALFTLAMLAVPLAYCQQEPSRAAVARAAATPWVDRMETSWRAGEYDKVLRIAEARLSKNSTDLVGLILVINYDSEYLNLTRLERSIDQAISVGAKVKSPHFAALYPRFVFVLRAEKVVAMNYTREQFERDKKKSGLKGKDLGFLEELQALELDGLVK